jgi:hypothetical protein
LESMVGQESAGRADGCGGVGCQGGGVGVGVGIGVSVSRSVQGWGVSSARPPAAAGPGTQAAPKGSGMSGTQMNSQAAARPQSSATSGGAQSSARPQAAAPGHAAGSAQAAAPGLSAGAAVTTGRTPGQAHGRGTEGGTGSGVFTAMNGMMDAFIAAVTDNLNGISGARAHSAQPAGFGHSATHAAPGAAAGPHGRPAR